MEDPSQKEEKKVNFFCLCCSSEYEEISPASCENVLKLYRCTECTTVFTDPARYAYYARMLCEKLNLF